MKRRSHIDHVLFIVLALLIVGGALLFSSAAFGLLARSGKAMASVFVSHLGFGVGVGLAALAIAASLDYRRLRTWAPHIFVFALIATALVFVPHLGMEHGGGRRWIVILGMSLQPSEILKLATLILAAAYAATVRDSIATLRWGVGGFAGIMAAPALLLIMQPDIGTLGVITLSTFSIFFAAGMRWRDMAIIALAGMLMLGTLIALKPYARDRIMTFVDPSQGKQAESYQVHQALIAIGSGGVSGRGFGQGVQKFTYLPEPMGDSIFAVAGEELGFIGAGAIIILFLLLGLRGYWVAGHSRDPFGVYLATGIATYLVIEAFINIASMLSMAPLTGIPLTFMSQGGSAMLMSLASAGVLLSVSRGRG